MNPETSLSRSPAGRIDLVQVPAALPTGLEYFEIRSDGEPVGSVDVRACPTCRIAVVIHIRVAEPYRRRGLATAALRAGMTSRPGYRWSTSPVEDTDGARAFWRVITAGGWPGTIGEAEECQHMREADQRLP
jgi:predicted acetyltransferase